MTPRLILIDSTGYIVADIARAFVPRVGEHIVCSAVGVASVRYRVREVEYAAGTPRDETQKGLEGWETVRALVDPDPWPPNHPLAPKSAATR